VIKPDDKLLLHALLDGELDAAGTLAFEQRLAEELDLAAEYEHLKTLSAALRRHVGKPAAPDALRNRVAAIAASPTQKVRQAWSWYALAASVVIAAGLGSGLTWVVLKAPAPQMDVAQLLVADHMRGLLSGQPVDVVSSDRHTVKPWFSEHFALAPRVADLSAQGFSLAGGRIDVVAGLPAPTLVYRYGGHFISLTALPAARTAPAKPSSALDGYNILSWNDGELVYWAVSDIEKAKLENFRRFFETADRP
jgi:anti-sigma factor RsiW